MRRYVILIASFCTCTFLILTLSLNCAAASQVNDIELHAINGYYFNSDVGYTEVMYYDNTSTSDGTYLYSFPSSVNLNSKTYNLRSVNILGNPSGSIELWQRGYIYTFTYEVRFPTPAVPQVSAVTFDFGLASLGVTSSGDEYISEFTPLGNVATAYGTSGNFTNFFVTSTVYVDDSFNFGNILSPDDCLLSLEISLFENTLANINVRIRDVTVTKAIGEESYYQASIDAITNIQEHLDNLSQNEYTWTYNFLNVDGKMDQIDTITGDVNEVLNGVKEYLTGFTNIVTALNNEVPVIYFPEWYIPFLDIDLRSLPGSSIFFQGNYLYPLDILNSMNPGIMRWLDVGKMFVRLTTLVTFASVTVFKMARLEWWL